MLLDGRGDLARSAASTNAVILSGATGVSRPERNRKISNSCLSSIVKHRIQARRFKKTHAIGPPTAGSPPLWSWNPAALRCQDDSIGGHGAFAPTHLTAEVSNHIPILLIFALIGFTPVFWMRNPAAPPSPGQPSISAQERVITRSRGRGRIPLSPPSSLFHVPFSIFHCLPHWVAGRNSAFSIFHLPFAIASALRGRGRIPLVSPLFAFPFSIFHFPCALVSALRGSGWITRTRPKTHDSRPDPAGRQRLTRA